MGCWRSRRGTRVATEEVVLVAAEHDVVLARQNARKLAASLGFGVADQALIATAVSEVARNIILYARRGEIRLSTVSGPNRQGIRIVAEDLGPGIADIELAMQDGYSTGGGLGLGLPGSRRLMDDFEIVSTVGVGTRITLTKWLR